MIPSDWPVSPYGYSVIGSAVNPSRSSLRSADRAGGAVARLTVSGLEPLRNSTAAMTARTINPATIAIVATDDPPPVPDPAVGDAGCPATAR